MEITEIQALQNCADYVGGVINENFEQDKRKKIKKYYLTIHGITESPVLDYENMQHFLLGMIRILNVIRRESIILK
jgi:isocitrate dehydrogenase